MEKFTKLNRAEMKSVLGGLRREDDDVECMGKKPGEDCGGDVVGICSKVFNNLPHDGGFHMRCDPAPNVPEPIQ